MTLDARDVEEILRLLDASPYDDLRLETDRFTLVVERSAAGDRLVTVDGAETTVADPAPGAPPEPDPSPPSVTDDEPPAPTGEAAAPGSADGLVEIRSPLLGTFYRAPKPGADPFVDVGSTIDEHTVVAIVEVMKLMNHVPAGLSGEIVEICAVNGELVEYGEVLFKVRAAE